MELLSLLLLISGSLLSEASLKVRHTYIDRSGSSVSSPNFPKDYNHNEICTYHVMAPAGSVVMLYFNHLDIEGIPDKECHDGLEIEHWDDSTTRSRRLCGANLPSPIYSLGNEMNLTFTTDATTSASGFHVFVYFTKPMDPYFPMDDVYFSLRLLMAFNVAIVIIITFLVVSCVVLYKRNVLQINVKERTKEKEYLTILDEDYPPTNPKAAPFDIKDGETSKKAPPSPESSQRGYLEMKPSFKNKKGGIKQRKRLKEPIHTPVEEYACPLPEKVEKAAYERNSVEYSQPADIELIGTNIQNTAIPEPKYSNTVIEGDASADTIQDTLDGISPTPENSQCYLEMKRGLKETAKSVHAVMSTYGDAESANIPESIYAVPITEPTPDVLKKRNTVEYSEPSFDVDKTDSVTAEATLHSEYNRVITEI